jgi:hypothetical protein
MLYEKAKIFSPEDFESSASCLVEIDFSPCDKYVTKIA